MDAAAANTPGSVLLLGDNDTARNGCPRAGARVAPECLVFAERRRPRQYLARYRQADLFWTLPPTAAPRSAMRCGPVCWC